MSFNSGRFNGRVSKSVKIDCNDSLNPFMELRFRATVNDPKQKLEYSPLAADFQTILVGKKSKIAIDLKNLDSTESKLVVVASPADDFIKTDIKKTKLKPEASTKIEFTLSKNAPVGPILTSLTLEAEDKPDSRITIPITGIIEQENKEGKGKASK